jgi:RimJ/RimL family protein N-acetyltransferase
MTFIRGQQIELRVLEDSDAEVFTKAVNAGLTTQHLLTGSIPMRTADYRERFAAERKAGDILFGVWWGLFTNRGQDPAVTGVPDGNIPKFIGTCGLHSHRDIYKSWESRFLIFDPSATGKGLGGEAVRLLTGYAFERLNAHRVWLGVSEANRRAVKCYLDAGYVFEGRLRDEIYYQGRYHAALRMSVLEDEWKSRTSVAAG